MVNVLFCCVCQPVTLTHVLENINLFFAALFGVEMLLKVFGHGIYGYIQDGFNVFDGFIVLLRYIRAVLGSNWLQVTKLQQ